MNDATYRTLFAFPRMVADLLRAAARGRWIDEVDFSTLEKLPAEHVGDQGQQRRGDAAWRVRTKDGDELLIVLEFQTTSDPRMALRMAEYASLLYRERNRQSRLPSPGRWPPVVPVVLHSGEEAWEAAEDMRDLVRGSLDEELEACRIRQRSLRLDAQTVAVDDMPSGSLMRAVAGIEQGREEDDFRAVLTGLRQTLDEPADAQLARAFWKAVTQAAAGFRPEGAPAPEFTSFEETSMDLFESMQTWPDKWERRGEVRGEIRGERQLVRRLVEQRFGAEFAMRTEPLLDALPDQERVTEAAMLAAHEPTAADLAERLAELGRRTN